MLLQAIVLLRILWLSLVVSMRMTACSTAGHTREGMYHPIYACRLVSKAKELFAENTSILISAWLFVHNQSFTSPDLNFHCKNGASYVSSI